MTNKHKHEEKAFKYEEQKIMDYLVNAWNGFINLETLHPSDKKDFMEGIHRCQRVISMRVLIRDYPNDFFSLSKKELELDK